MAPGSLRDAGRSRRRPAAGLRPGTGGTGRCGAGYTHARPVSHALRRAAARVLVPLGYVLLAVAASWPLARDFTTRTIGEVFFDERHALWVIWYTAQAMAGRVSWPYTTDLLHPHGISVLVDGIGPLNAVLALPFWPWGAAAAFNGAALAGLALSGWCCYALARVVGLARGPAFFAGVLFLLWPIHLIGLTGHLEKVFTGMLPLTLAAGLRAFDPARPPAWLLAPGLGLLGALLQNGNQFMFAVLGLAIVGVLEWWAAPGERWARQRRMLIAAAIAGVVCAPLLVAMVRVMREPGLEVALGAYAWFYSPDALSLILPSPHQRWATWLYPSDVPVRDFVWASTVSGLNPTSVWYGTGLETAVTIPITALVLCACGWRDRAARRWIALGSAGAVLCLGPLLRVGGVMTPLRTPYVVLKRVPGFDVMRTPGRLMLLGSAGFAIGAGLGLSALSRGGRSRTGVVTLAAITLAAAECWPRPWPQMALPRVPDFYRQLALDRSGGAVLDLPAGVNDPGRSSAYMYYQTVHRHPIAWAYLSRGHLQYPNAGLEGLWDPLAPAGTPLRARLRTLGYRYVVVHRFPGLFTLGRLAGGAGGAPRAEPTPPSSERLIREAFAGQAPVHEDDLVAVWAIE